MNGFAGELANTAGGTVINQVIDGLLTADPFSKVSLASLGSAVGSFLGTKLASEIVSFDTVGGQLGSAVGSSLGVIGVTAAITGTGSSAMLLGAQLGAFAGPVAAAAGAFIGFIAGGLIGSLFGGTPRSGADVVWDPESGRFGAGNGYARKGGSRDAALSMAGAVAETFNAVLAATGGRLAAPELVTAGNYGMRKKEYVYRPTSTTDTDAITRRYSGKTGAERLIAYGSFQGLDDPDFQIVGGDVYAKRALYNGLDMAGVSGDNFDQAALLGDLATARRYATYLQNSASINALIAAEPDSVFTAEWAITLARAVELGLTRRHAGDWHGGYGALMAEAGVTPAAVAFGFDYDPLADRVSRVTSLGDYVLGDAIDVAGQTVVEGTAGGDTIRLVGDQLLAKSGGTNVGLTVDGAAHTAARTIAVAATVDAGAGDDSVHASDRGDNVLGGAGDDTLVGGLLDDWLLGGDGADRLFAGRVATTSFTDGDTARANAALGVAGGSGNHLDGGAGEDRVFGGAGSDWLAGGEGIDRLLGGAGGDVLDAGAGDEGAAAAPGVQGGGGSDQYLFRRGDGQDVYWDDAGLEAGGEAPVAGTDSISARVKARSAGTQARAWAGDGEFSVDGSTRGGEDAIAFGEGITLLDLLLVRSGTVKAPGMDLIIRIQGPDSDGDGEGDWDVGGDQITVKDWFEGTRRIEWLRFADGSEVRLGDFTSFRKGTSSDDVMIGTGGADVQDGGAGDDDIWGLGGDDWQLGGRGDDAVHGNDDNDLTLGGEGDDDVLGGIGNDTVSGDAGNDEVYGGAGADLVIGGRGDDEVAGGAGDDVIKYSRGDGRDTVYDEFAGIWELVWQGDYTNGYVLDGNGRVTKGGVTYNDGTSWIGRYDYNELGGLKSLYRLVPPVSGATNADSGSDVLEFGVGIDLQDVVFRQEGNDLRIAVTRAGGATDRFDEVADQIRIKDWYTSVAGGSIEKFQFVNTGEQLASAMSLRGGTDGADAVVAVAGKSAWITAGAGDDAVTGTAVADILAGNSGSDVLTADAGSDVLFGGDGDDVLVGGADADVLLGGAGIDTASFAGSAAVIVFLDPNQGTSTGDAAGDSLTSIENLTGGAGADRLYGDAGDNVLDGGVGDDRLYGGAGNDIYQLSVGGGADTVVDRVMSGTSIVAGNPGDDTVELGAGLSFSSLLFVKNGFHLELQLAASPSTKLILTDFFRSAEDRIETLVTDDGVTADLGRLTLAGTAATTGADLVVGTAAADTLGGLDGNDAVVGGAGADVLSGWNGEDTLEGGADGDKLNGGYDTVSGGVVVTIDNGVDTIRYAGSSGAVSVDLSTRLLSGGEAQGDTIAVAGGVSTIENVVGSNLGDTLTGDSRANILEGLAGSDMLSGGDGDDVLRGGDDADTLSGGDGADAIEAGNGDDTTVRGGDGNDLLAGNAGNDALDGGTGNDTVSGDEGNDRLWGGTGDDTVGGGVGADALAGEAGNDTLSGGADADTLDGGDGQDILQGDEGDDLLAGGVGDDTYVFAAGSGSDRITDADGVNRIVITGASSAEVWLTRVGSDLKVGFIGRADTILIANVFATTAPGSVREIATTDGSLFLKYAGVPSYSGSLIEKMTAANASAPGSPDQVPEAVKALQSAMWWNGGKAAPSINDVSFSPREDTTYRRTLTATDHDENVASYSVAEQATHGTVTVDAATGEWAYRPTLNYNGADSFTLRVTDADQQSDDAAFTVDVTAVNDLPVFEAVQPVLDAPEKGRAGLMVGELLASDADGDRVTFRPLPEDSPYRIASDGTLRVRDGNLLNWTVRQSETIVVSISDGIGADVSRTFTIKTINIPEAPSKPAIVGTPLSRVAEPIGTEASLAGRTIATFSATDPDGTVPGFRIRQAPSGVFAMSGTSLVFGPNQTTDFRALVNRPDAIRVNRDSDGYVEVEFTAIVESWDGEKSSVEATSVTVAVEDTNEAPTAILFTSPITPERDHPKAGDSIAAPVSLGRLGVDDPDLDEAGDSFIYSTTTASFEVVNDNELRLRGGAALDYEAALVEADTGNRYVNVSLTVKDRDGNTGSKTLTQTKKVYVSDRTDYLYGTPGDESLTGGTGIDVLYGYDGNDTLSGLGGADVLNGGNGADALRGGIGGDTYVGGEGDDSILDDAVENVSDEADGDAGDDRIALGGGDDVLAGGSGNDVLLGGLGNDLVQGEDGDDTLFGAEGDDRVYGGDDNDILSGGAGRDQFDGGRGFDIVDYGFTDEGKPATSPVKVDLDNTANNVGVAMGDSYVAVEAVYGTSGNDVLWGRNSADDTLKGGAGTDELYGRGDDDILDGQDGNDKAFGEAGNDDLYGGAGTDELRGGEGNDELVGGTGDDVLHGDANYDRLVGGTGNDLLVGGAGSDTYVIARGDGDDRIDQVGAVDGDRDLLGFVEGLTNRNLWFEWAGGDVKVKVLGGAGVDNSVTLLRYQANGRSNVESVIAADQQLKTKDLAIGALATTMDRFVTAIGYRPTTQAQFDALYSNTTTKLDGLTFRQHWDNFWSANEAPTLQILNAAGWNAGWQEDQFNGNAFTVQVRLNDDQGQLPNLGFLVREVGSEGSKKIASSLFSSIEAIKPLDDNGLASIRIKTRPNASGTRYLWITTTDAGGLASDRWIPVTVAAVADKPTVSTAESPGGNAGTPISVVVEASPADTESSVDGAERISMIGVHNLPSELSFNRGFRRDDGVWILSASHLPGLTVQSPSTWYRDLAGTGALVFDIWSEEPGNGAMAVTSRSVDVRINGTPAVPTLTNGAIAEHVAAGSVVGQVIVADPDRFELNPFEWSRTTLWNAEARWLDGTAGPLGGGVRVLQTGQSGSGYGGGAESVAFAIDRTKAYKFSVYVRGDSLTDTRAYMGIAPGTSVLVENAVSGTDEGTPVFVSPTVNTLIKDQWYRLEGYVLPQGSANVTAGAYGGVFNVATGQKVADASVFRWNDTLPAGTDGVMRIYNRLGAAQGFSTSWYQPLVEQLPVLTVTSASGVSVDAAGIVRVLAEPDYERATRLPFSVVATDGGGLSSTLSSEVAITPVNERPSMNLTGSTLAYFTETGLGTKPADPHRVVVKLAVSDPDRTTPTLEFAPGGNPNNWFYIDQASKEVRFRSASDNFSYEWAKASGATVGDRNGDTVPEAHVADVLVRATDGALTSDTLKVQVLIQDVPEDPVNLRADRVLTIPETQGAGLIARLLAEDPDGQAVDYRIMDGMDGGGKFYLEADGRLGTTGGFDYEKVKDYSLRVKASDTTGLSTIRDFSVSVTNVNEKPSTPSVAVQNIFPETSDASQTQALIARFKMEDIDGDMPSLAILGGNDQGWFKTIGTDHIAFSETATLTAGWLHGIMGTRGIDPAYSYDRDEDGALEVRVATLRLAAQDSDGLTSGPFDYDVLIEDANEAPSITSAGFVVAEASPGAGITKVGQLAWTDPDASAKFRSPTFKIDSGNGSQMFSIDPVSGVISLQGALNYQAQSTYTLGVSITDKGGLSSSSPITISVTTTNKAPNPQFRSAEYRVNHITAYFDPNDADHTSGFTVKDFESDVSWHVSGRYDPALNRIVLEADGNVDWWAYDPGTISATVVDPKGAETRFSWYGSMGGPKTPTSGYASPVVVDLDGDGVELTSLAASQVMFDMDGDGSLNRTGWVGADDGLLVFDKNGSGAIDHISEISFTADFAGATSDLQGLRAYDTDEDGYFDADDAQFGNFQIWRDGNQNGVTDAGELTTLADRGLTAVRLDLDETGIPVEGATDNVLFATSETYRRNGSTLDIGDVFFAYEVNQTQEDQPIASERAFTSTGRNAMLAGRSQPFSRLETRPRLAFTGIDPTLPLPAKLRKQVGAATSAGSVTSPVASSTRPLAGPTALAGLPQEQVAALVPSAEGQPNAASLPSPTPVGSFPATPASLPLQAPTARAAHRANQPVAASPAEAQTAPDPATTPEALTPLPSAETTYDANRLASSPRPSSQVGSTAGAAALLRSSRPASLSAFGHAALGQGGVTPGVMPATADLRVEQLIAAMAAFQGGAALGSSELGVNAPVDHLLAQLAPAV